MGVCCYYIGTLPLRHRLLAKADWARTANDFAAGRGIGAYADYCIEAKYFVAAAISCSFSVNDPLCANVGTPSNTDVIS